MSILWCDFETRSKCDLKAHGVYNYAMDPTTEVLCLCYAFDDGEVQTWVPQRETPDLTIPMDLLHHKGQIRAHNAAFERLIFEHVLCFNYDPEQFYCTATQARANCAPGALGDVGRFAGAGMKKDYRGAQLIRWLSIPRPDGTFMEDAKLLQEMCEYCAQDVRVMREVSKSMRELTEEEIYDYHVNERINDRGVLVDVPLCEAAVQYAAQEAKEIEQLVQEITNGEITSVRSSKMKEWVYERVGAQAKNMMSEGIALRPGDVLSVREVENNTRTCVDYFCTYITENGGIATKKVDAEEYKNEKNKAINVKVSIDKSVRANLLSLAEDNQDEIHPSVADVIQCADDIWASSVAKFKKLADLADFDDDRVRGAFVFAGGSATGRASSYGAQVHNFGRKCADDPEAVRTAMVRGHKLVPTYGRTVNDVLKQMLRPALMAAPGKMLVVADWSSIEARVTPWCSACPAGESKLDLFATGADVYKVNAAATFKKTIEEITKDERQIGKVQELACGFAGGIGAFASMGKNYGVNLSDSESQRMVDGWRRANNWALPYWQDLEAAYTRAMRNPGYEFPVGRVVYMFDGTHLWYALPSGRILCYPFAILDEEGVSYAKASWKPAADAKEWPRARLWRGLACENITQAVAADILRHALRELDDLYYDIVLHVHDEIVVETDDPEKTVKDMTRIMTTAPAWAEGLPLAIEIETMTRYSK